MSPSDFGEILKPFVFHDLFDHESEPFKGGLHPHSGLQSSSLESAPTWKRLAPTDRFF